MLATLCPHPCFLGQWPAVLKTVSRTLSRSCFLVWIMWIFCQCATLWRHQCYCVPIHASICLCPALAKSLCLMSPRWPPFHPLFASPPSQKMKNTSVCPSPRMHYVHPTIGGCRHLSKVLGSGEHLDLRVADLGMRAPCKSISQRCDSLCGRSQNVRELAFPTSKLRGHFVWRLGAMTTISAYNLLGTTLITEESGQHRLRSELTPKRYVSCPSRCHLAVSCRALGRCGSFLQPFLSGATGSEISQGLDPEVHSCLTLVLSARGVCSEKFFSFLW